MLFTTNGFRVRLWALLWSFPATSSSSGSSWPLLTEFPNSFPGSGENVGLRLTTTASSFLNHQGDCDGRGCHSCGGRAYSHPTQHRSIGSARGRKVHQRRAGKSGKSELLTNNEISVSVEETFPTAEAVHVLFTLGGGVALEVFKQVILPWLKEKYETRFKSGNKEGGKDEVKQ